MIGDRVGGGYNAVAPGDPGLTGPFSRLGALRLSISSTVLWFVVLPAVIVVVISALSLAGSSSSRRARRYRPGRPYDFTPIWFVAAPEQVGPDAGVRPSGRRAHPAALESGVVETGGRTPTAATGGASDRW